MFDVNIIDTIGKKAQRPQTQLQKNNIINRELPKPLNLLIEHELDEQSPFITQAEQTLKPIKKEYDSYTRDIRQVFKIAFDFLEKHKYARTDEEWQAVFADIDKIHEIINAENNRAYKLLVDLLVAVVDEIERNQNLSC